MSMQQPIPLPHNAIQNPYLGKRSSRSPTLGTASEREPGVANIKISWHGNKNKRTDLWYPPDDGAVDPNSLFSENMSRLALPNSFAKSLARSLVICNIKNNPVEHLLHIATSMSKHPYSYSNFRH